MEHLDPFAVSLMGQNDIMRSLFYAIILIIKIVSVISQKKISLCIIRQRLTFPSGQLRMPTKIT